MFHIEAPAKSVERNLVHPNTFCLQFIHHQTDTGNRHGTVIEVATTTVNDSDDDDTDKWGENREAGD